MRLPEAGREGWIDGGRVPIGELRIGVDDPAFHAGLGLFETIAVRGGRLLDFDAHLERLAAGAERLRLSLPELARLREIPIEAASSIVCGWVKVIVTGGGRWFVFGSEMDPAEEGRAVRAVLLPWRRNPADALAGLKTLNYAANLLGADEARRRGADEGLWLNTRGHLTEGCISNLFVVRRRALFTASERDGILPGIVRGLALRAAGGLGLAVHVGKLRLPRLRGADEAFLTSSLRAVRPLVEYEGRPVGSGRPGPVTAAVAAAVAALRSAS